MARITYFSVQLKILKALGKSTYHFTLGMVLLIPFILFVLVIQLPIYLYRLLLIKLIAPMFRPRIGKAVTIDGQFFATEFLKNNVYGYQKFRYQIVVTVVLKGDVLMEELTSLITKRWIYATRVNPDGVQELRYPEFQQYIDYWKGFMFWKQDSHFDLRNHIFSHQLSQNEKSEKSSGFIDQLVENLINESFPLQTSPWQVHLLRNYSSSEFPDGENLTAIVLRFHHAMVDGESMLHLIVNDLFDNCTVRVSIGNNSGYIATQKCFLAKLRNLIQIPFRFIKDFGFVMSLLWSRQRPWESQKFRLLDLEHGCSRAIGRQMCQKSPLISMKKLKYIKNNFGVTLSSVLLSALSAAVAKSVSTNRESESILISSTLSTQVHREKLRNFTLPTVYELDTPSNILVSAKDRLALVEKNYQQAKQSLVTKFLLPITRIFSGSLATSFARIPTSRMVPVSTTNFPGPAVYGLDSERRVIQMHASAGTMADVFLAFFSYNGFIRMAVTAEESVLDRVQLETILEDFCEEIEILHDLATRERTVIS